MVFNIHEDPEAQALMLDIRRCRANCLKECPVDIPVFTCLDSIVPAEPYQLYDLAYISKEYKISNGQRALSLAPYQGPGWYTRVAQEACLFYGIVSFSDFLNNCKSNERVLRCISAYKLSRWIIEAF